VCCVCVLDNSHLITFIVDLDWDLNGVKIEERVGVGKGRRLISTGY
jgi:hypothetical protein